MSVVCGCCAIGYVDFLWLAWAELQALLHCFTPPSRCPKSVKIAGCDVCDLWMVCDWLCELLKACMIWFPCFTSLSHSSAFPVTSSPFYNTLICSKSVKIAVCDVYILWTYQCLHDLIYMCYTTDSLFNLHPHLFHPSTMHCLFKVC